MTDMKPCPFCNNDDLRESKNIFISRKEEIDELIIQVCCVCCLNCGTSGPAIAYVKDPKQAWNDRK